MIAGLAVLFALALVAGGFYAWLGRPQVSDAELQVSVNDLLEGLKVQWDPRLFVCEVRAQVARGAVTLEGFVDGIKRDDLLSAVRALAGVRRVTDRAVQLPDPALGPEVTGLVGVAVANLGDGPGQDQGDHVVTQARLADPVEVLRQEGGWYLVRMTDDGYLGWLNGENLIRLDQAALAAYSDREQVLVTVKFATIRRPRPPGEPGDGTVSTPDTEGTGVIMTAVMGTILPVALDGADGLPGGSGGEPGVGGGGEPTGSEDYLGVVLPDGEAGLIKVSEVRRLPSARAVFTEARPAEAIIALAEEYRGLPYLWGGTTSQGFDCSGFVQFVFGMNGYQLPRDADMQFKVGAPVADRSQLRPGDLVFWTTYKAGPSHIGIYIGGARYIHSGGTNGVTINSFDPQALDYSEKLDQAYIGARRVIEAGQ